MNKEETGPAVDSEMRKVLEIMLAEDTNITARAVVRLHPTLSAASSITRSGSRTKLLVEYQQRQAEFRRWSKRASKLSGASLTSALAEKDIRISELEMSVQILTASHVALLRAVGELGGFNKWASFYESYRNVRERLQELKAVPEGLLIPFPSDGAKSPRK